MISDSEVPKKLSKNESIKENSDFLRGTILEGLADDSTGAISADDSQLTKFHGTYLQDDRDLRSERLKQKLGKAFSFMIRIRVPGGVCTPSQWLHVDRDRWRGHFAVLGEQVLIGDVQNEERDEGRDVVGIIHNRPSPNRELSRPLIFVAKESVVDRVVHAAIGEDPREDDRPLVAPAFHSVQAIVGYRINRK